MTMNRIFGQHEVSAYLPEKQNDTVVYIHLNGKNGDEIWSRLDEPKPMLVTIAGTDWNAELSPWKAERVFKNGEDFAGGAEQHLRFILDEVIPWAEKTIKPRKRVIAGYSLGGLFALWSAYKTDAFDYVMSASGSLWFDGFTDFAAAEESVKTPERIYFSLGDRERKTGNRKMSKVEEATAAIADIMQQRGAKVFCEFNAGGHFDNVPDRIVRGINKILSEETVWK